MCSLSTQTACLIADRREFSDPNSSIGRDRARLEIPISSSFFLFVSVLFDKNFAGTNFRIVSVDFLFGRTACYTATAHIELRSVPRTLHGTSDQSPVEERAALVRASVGDGKDSISAEANRYAFILNSD